jgi:pimeloyl-[acyl-carrier protein] methyl ester esterase
VKTQWVFIPGLHGTAISFAPLLRILEGTVHELPKEGPQDYASLSPWFNSLAFPKKYVVVAESFGGPLALLHASSRPKGLRGVVLLGSFARMGVPGASLMSYLIPPLPLASSVFKVVLQRLLFSGQASQAKLDNFQREVRGTSAWVFRARFQEVMRCDVRGALPRIEVPVLSLRARADSMVPDLAEDDLKGIPKLRHGSIESPHVIAATHPRELAKILGDFERTL